MIIAFGEAVGSGADTFVPASQAEDPQLEEQTASESVEQQVESPSTEPPKEYASKGDWVEYAVSQGADRDEAENSTKAELIELYGEGS